MPSIIIYIHWTKRDTEICEIASQVTMINYVMIFLGILTNTNLCTFTDIPLVSCFFSVITLANTFLNDTSYYEEII